MRLLSANYYVQSVKVRVVVSLTYIFFVYYEK